LDFTGCCCFFVAVGEAVGDEDGVADNEDVDDDDDVLL
jgi:hypothetical protein